MRVSGRKLLEIGIAPCLLAAYVLSGSTALAGSGPGGPDQVTPVRSGQTAEPMRLAQNQAPADPTVGQDQNVHPGYVQPGAPPPPAEIPKPFHGSVSFEAGSGKILTLTLPAANIYVADPKVAEVRPASSTSLFVFGVGPGHTTIAAVDALGRLLADYDITVRPSGFGAREAQGAIHRLVPGSQVQVRPQGKGLMLTGGVANAADAAQAMMIAKGFGGVEASLIDNQLTIAKPTQVTLMVRIAEMKRSIVRTLGVDWGAAVKIGTAVGVPAAIPSAATPFISGILNSATCATAPGRLCFDTVLNALAKDGLAHILAEPNLTVMSGQPASFQAGGEYPVPISSGSGATATVSISYKPYGVLLNFLPTVMSDGRINLHVKPEVSELNSTNSVGVAAGTTALSIAALKVRRVETTVELGSGESFAIAGMLQTSNGDNGSGLPGLGDTPILGALFKTNSMTREQTELVIVVTPLLVRPVRNVAQLQIPGDGYKPPGDVDRLLLMRQVPNRDGTVAARPTVEAGFMVR